MKIYVGFVSIGGYLIALALVIKYLVWRLTNGD